MKKPKKMCIKNSLRKLSKQETTEGKGKNKK
jgi:hypothetical protein